MEYLNCFDSFEIKNNTNAVLTTPFKHIQSSFLGYVARHGIVSPTKQILITKLLLQRGVKGCVTRLLGTQRTPSLAHYWIFTFGFRWTIYLLEIYLFFVAEYKIFHINKILIGFLVMLVENILCTAY